MRYLILIGIRLYWLLPKKFRKKCLYRETCSRYVYRIARKYGFKEGIRALSRRIETCRPKYKIVEIDDQRIVICSNGKTISKEEMAKWLLK